MDNESLKYTPWYSGDIHPVRTGYYQCKDCMDLHYWNGKEWLLEPDSQLVIDVTFWRGVRK
jgi:hypothetical protein